MLYNWLCLRPFAAVAKVVCRVPAKLQLANPYEGAAFIPSVHYTTGGNHKVMPGDALGQGRSKKQGRKCNFFRL